MKPAKLKKSSDDGKAMFSYVSLFENMGDALAFEKAALATDPKHLPPCAKIVKGRRWAERDLLALARCDGRSLELKSARPGLF